MFDKHTPAAPRRALRSIQLMERDRNLLIRASIDHALANETTTNSLQHYVAAKLPYLHRTIQLPELSSVETLVAFLNRYIEHVPDFLDALIELSKSAGIFPFIAKIVDIAQSFFKTPPELLDDHSGMIALVDEAYLAHRLMEEINDRFISKCGIPLIPMDMTMSNIIVHSLMEPDFANKLDLAVHYSIEALFENFGELDNAELMTFTTLHHSEGWGDMLNNWPCLAGDSSIALDFEPQTLRISVH